MRWLLRWVKARPWPVPLPQPRAGQLEARGQPQPWASGISPGMNQGWAGKGRGVTGQRIKFKPSSEDESSTSAKLAFKT